MTSTEFHDMTVRRAGFSALFASGFRPFFLLAGLDAALNMMTWLTVYFRPGLWPDSAMPAVYWHAHEMLFGFVAAAVGGFLLTAVPNWTGSDPYRGAPLYLLVAVWLAGRLAMLPFMPLSPVDRATVDLAFYPLLAATLAPRLIGARKLRNMMFLVLLAALFTGNLLFHLGASGVLTAGEHIGLMVAADIITIMIVIVGGRILPAFTRGGLAAQGIPVQLAADPWLERFSILSVLAMMIADMTMPLSRLSGGVTLLAAVAQIFRLSQWQGWRTLRIPLLWVLHLGYAWLALGLLLKGTWLLFSVPLAQNWIHALTIGAFSTMILAVMSRASLGHSGRPLVAPKPVALAYGLLSAAAAVRVFCPVLVPDHSDIAIIVAGLLWIGTFTLFLWVYAPIFVTPRLDGMPG
jgi:uncharacterized protein involved in response to NO